jgi:hypothetical protein
MGNSGVVTMDVKELKNDYGLEEERVFERQKLCLIEPIRLIIQSKINFSCISALEKNYSNY